MSGDSQSMRKLAFSCLPAVIIELIVSFSSIPDMLRISTVCKDFHSNVILSLRRNVKQLSLRMISRRLILERMPASFIVNHLHSLQSLDPGMLDAILAWRYRLADRLAIQRACPELDTLLLKQEELESVDPVSVLPSLLRIRKLHYDVYFDAMPLPLLQFLDSACPMLEEIRIHVPLANESHTALVEKLLRRCSSVQTFAKWNGFSCSYSSDSGKSLIRLFNSVGMERMKESLRSLRIEGFPDVVDALFPSSSSSASCCCWSALHTLRVLACKIEVRAVDVLERVATQCPVLANLDIGMGGMPYDAQPHSCGVSESALCFFSQRLLSLTLANTDWLNMDFLKQLSLRSARITDLRLTCSVWSDGPLQLLIEALPRFRCLTAFSYSDQFDNCLDTVLDGLDAIPSATASELRSLDIDARRGYLTHSALLSLLQHRPLLDRLHLTDRLAYIMQPLQCMVNEERAKESGRLALSDLLISS